MISAGEFRNGITFEQDGNVYPVSYTHLDVYKRQGQGAEAGISFMLPYLENPFLWQHQQIHAEFTGGHIALQLGGLRLGRPDFWRINRMRREGFRPTIDTSHIGPLCLDVYKRQEHVRAEVYKKFSVTLQNEICIVGDIRCLLYTSRCV